MKEATKFILVYFSCFFIAAFTAILFWGDPSYNEMIGYTIAGCLYYAVAGSIPLYILYTTTSKIQQSFLRFVIRIVSGFILLELLLYLTDGTGNTKFLIALNIIHLISFSIALLCNEKN